LLHTFRFLTSAPHQKISSSRMSMRYTRSTDWIGFRTPTLRNSQLGTAPLWACNNQYLAFFLLPFSFFIISCGFDVEDPKPPAAPVWVEKSLPEEWPEGGINAHESGRLFLEWEPNLQDNIESYSLLRTQYYVTEDSLGAFEQIHRLDLNGAMDLSYLGPEVQTRILYFYNLQPEAVSGN